MVGAQRYAEAPLGVVCPAGHFTGKSPATAGRVQGTSPCVSGVPPGLAKARRGQSLCNALNVHRISPEIASEVPHAAARSSGDQAKQCCLWSRQPKITEVCLPRTPSCPVGGTQEKPDALWGRLAVRERWIRLGSRGHRSRATVTLRAWSPRRARLHRACLRQPQGDRARGHGQHRERAVPRSRLTHSEEGPETAARR